MMRYKRKIIAILSLALLTSVGLAYGASASAIQGSKQEGVGYTPPGGMIPDAETAKLVANIVLSRIYGSKLIQEEQPFRVALREGVWIVMGKSLPPDTAGGVAVIKISKADGRIMYVMHGK
jgi:hypothetical protein